MHQILFRAEVPFGPLNRCMAQPQLDPLQFPTCRPRLCHAACGELEQIQFLFGACLCADDGALSGLQAEPLIGGE